MVISTSTLSMTYEIAEEINATFFFFSCDLFTLGKISSKAKFKLDMYFPHPLLFLFLNFLAGTLWTGRDVALSLLPIWQKVRKKKNFQKYPNTRHNFLDMTYFRHLSLWSEKAGSRNQSNFENKYSVTFFSSHLSKEMLTSNTC